MTGLINQPQSVEACVLHVLAGPYENLMPRRIPEQRFASADGAVKTRPISLAWLSEASIPLPHSDLADQANQSRLSIAARAIREDFSSTTHPLLVLPELSLQILSDSAPAPGRTTATEMLRRLSAHLPGTPIDIRIAAVAGLDDGPTERERLQHYARVLLEHLTTSGIEIVTASVQAIRPPHPVYWSMVLNRLSRLGDAGPAQAEVLVAGLSDDELKVAMTSTDGRQLLELAPPTRRQMVSIPTSNKMVDPAPERMPKRTIDLQGRKVTFVCEKLADRSGGAERVLIEVANELSRRGYQVEIVSHERRGKPPFYPLEFGVVHMNLNPHRGAGTRRERLVQRANAALQTTELIFPLDRIAFARRYSAFSRRLAEHIDATRPDVVVPFMPPAIVACALAGTDHRPRLVASMHNAPEQDFENPVRWDPGRYARRRRLQLMERMSAIGVLLPAYQEWYPANLRSRTTVVPNAVRSVPEQTLLSARRRKTVLAVGRLADTKRHDLSIRAFAAVASEFPDWQLKIYGTGPLRDELTSLISRLGLEGRAHVLGHTTAIAAEYLSAEVLCHPARFEGFPLAVTEALASGLPVVGFADCSGLNALVADDLNGLLLDPTDGSDASRLAALTGGLRRMMSDDSLRARLRAAGPASMEPFAPDAVIDRWESVLFPASTGTAI